LGQGQSGTLVYTKDTLLHPLLVGKIGEFPVQMLWLIFVAVLCWILLNRHKFGAHMFLIGDNANSAELMGINTGRTRVIGFMLIGLVSAFAGVVASLHVTYFWPSLGDGYLLRTLASVFLGGTSVFGGTGTIFGTFIGAFIIGAIEAATVAIGWTGFYTQLIYGLIIVLSVIMHTYLRKRME
jgi:simple sugar transport system permease protein